MSDTLPTLGFVGLGLMGAAMTARLREVGFAVQGYDIDAVKLSAAADNGLTPVDTPAALAESCDMVLVCVTATPAVQDVVFGKNGVAAGGSAGNILIDFSTTV
ncbi:MAG: NAD(P)-binding domain-containing protein, partial [Pseudomonadota bacterium]